MRRMDNKKRRRLRLNCAVRPDIMRFLSATLLDGWHFYVRPRYPKIRKILRFWTGAGISIGVLAAVVFLFLGAPAGCLEAKYDLLRNHYEIRAYGYGRKQEAAYRKMLERYGIVYRYVDISPFNPFTTDFVAAYNRTMKKAIRSNLDLDVESLLRLFRVLERIEGDTAPGQTSLVAFREQILPVDPDLAGDDADGPTVLMQTHTPDAGSPDHFELSECRTLLQSDLNGDSVAEDICLRELRFKEWDRRFMKKSVVVDVYQEKEKILRQELDLEAFWQERFLEMVDLNADKRQELVTTAKFGPLCAGCSARRIYAFKEDRFERVLQVFDAEPDITMARRCMWMWDPRGFGTKKVQVWARACQMTIS